MKAHKILLVEKDLLARQAITKVLRKQGSYRIKATSAIGRNVEATITEKNPDVVLFNLEEIKSGEFEVFTKLRVRFPELPVVVVSPRNEKGANAAITALTMGAVDVLTKPNRCNNLLFANRHLVKRLIPIVEMAATQGEKSTDFYHDRDRRSVSPIATDGGMENKKAGVIVLGACSGGPKSLFSIIPDLPKDLSVPVVVAQHLPKIYTKVLADKLNMKSQVRVREVYNDAELVPGVVWVAPGGYHTEIHREGFKTVLRTHRGPRELGERPAINILFRSAARYFKNNTLGIVLSGLGMDGLSGSEAICEAGGELIIQDPKFSVAPEVLEKILRAGFTTTVCNVEEIAGEIIRRAPEPTESSYQLASKMEKGASKPGMYDFRNRMEFSSF